MKLFINERILVSGDLWEPNDKEDFDKNIVKMIESLNCIHFLNGCESFYNGEGLKDLFENLNFVNEVEDFYLFNSIDLLRTSIVDNDLVDWSQNKVHKDDFNYLIQLSNGFCPYPANNTSIAEASEFKYNEFNTIVLNFLSSDLNCFPNIFVNRVNQNPPNDMKLLELNISHLKDQILMYFLKNRESIAFLLNPKHGENHIKVKLIKGEIISPLECTKEIANELLQLAVSYKNAKDLYSFDNVRGKYIIFKYDNTTKPKTYHGYHPHDQNEIPNKVKDFIKSNIVSLMNTK